MITIGGVRLNQASATVRRAMGCWGVFVGDIPVDYSLSESTARTVAETIRSLPDKTEAKIDGGKVIVRGKPVTAQTFFV